MTTLTSPLPDFYRSIGEYKWHYALEHMKNLGATTFIVEYGPANWLFYLTKEKNGIHRKVKQVSEKQKNKEKYGNLLEEQRQNIMKLEQNEA
jgi:hypothetical protein